MEDVQSSASAAHSQPIRPVREGAGHPKVYQSELCMCLEGVKSLPHCPTVYQSDLHVRVQDVQQSTAQSCTHVWKTINHCLTVQESTNRTCKRHWKTSNNFQHQQMIISFMHDQVRKKKIIQLVILTGFNHGNRGNSHTVLSENISF